MPDELLSEEEKADLGHLCAWLRATGMSGTAATVARLLAEVHRLRTERDAAVREAVAEFVASGPCEYKDCDGVRPATSKAFSREADKVLNVCDSHRENVLDERSPEYVESCPVCGCGWPVN